MSLRCFDLDKINEVVFSQDSSRISTGPDQVQILLKEQEGLYALKVAPLYLGDDRIGKLPRIEITLDNDLHLWDKCGENRTYAGLKAPTKLGVWHCQMLWTSCKVGFGGIGQSGLR